MKIINTETKQIDVVNDKQALRVIARTDGLWVEYQESKTDTKAEEEKIDVPTNRKQNPRKTTRKRSVKRKPK